MAVSMLSAASTLHRHLPKRSFPNVLIYNAFFSTVSRRKPAAAPLPSSMRTPMNKTDSSVNIKNNNNNNSSTSKPDWRDWFRSPDYDDPWSPYQSFQEEEELASAVDTTNKRDNPNVTIMVSSVLDGTWVRRRHGMNLEPLRMLHRGLDEEDYVQMQQGDDSTRINDENPNNINSLHHQQEQEEHEDGIPTQGAEDQEEVTNARRRMRWVDAQTRFLCRMLDDLYRTGIRRETDRPRTERCHRAIGKLVTMTPENPPKIYEAQQKNMTFTGLAQRAGAILQRMEQCSPPLLQSKQSKSAKNNVEEILEESAGGNDTLSNTFSMGSSYQGVYADVAPHLSLTKYALPTPSREIYNMVLKSYAKESGPMHIAQQAEDVIWSMILRAVQQMQQPQPQHDSDDYDDVDSEEIQGDIIFPSMENWNCALTCWSRCTDPDRGYHAYSFLLTWLEWNEKRRDIVELRDMSIMDVNYPNRESFHLVLQSCLVEGEAEFNDDAEFQRAKEMGSGVAIRFWKERQKWDDIVLNSTTYCQVIRALCQTSELPSASSKARALQDLVRVYTKCCEDGMDTPEILDIVRAATTESQFVQLNAKMDSNK